MEGRRKHGVRWSMRSKENTQYRIHFRNLCVLKFTYKQRHYAVIWRHEGLTCRYLYLNLLLTAWTLKWNCTHTLRKPHRNWWGPRQVQCCSHLTLLRTSENVNIYVASHKYTDMGVVKHETHNTEMSQNEECFKCRAVQNVNVFFWTCFHNIH